MSGLTRFPATGSFDLAGLPYLGGVIGLNPGGDNTGADNSRGVVTFFWTVAGGGIVGTQGMPLSSQIVSMAEMRLLNRGPSVYLTYQAFSGTNGLAATFFSTSVGGALPLLCGDTILHEEIDKDMPANTAWAIYPCDYFAGTVGVYFDAVTADGVPVPSARATFYGTNLTNDDRKLDVVSPGRATVIVPIGTWFVVVWNPTPAPIKYTLSVVPLLT
jgi:hypothetical protein